MKSFEATGRTVEEAISSGLAEQGLSIGDVNIEIIEEGSKGLFGLFGSRQAKVRLTLREDEGLQPRDVFQDSLNPRSQRDRTANEASVPETRPEPKAREPRPPRQEKPALKAQEPEAAAPQKETRNARPDTRSRKSKAKREEKQAAPVRQEKMPRQPRENKPAAPAAQADPSTPQGQAQQFLQQLTKLMGLEISVAVSVSDDGHIYVTMDGDPQGILIGRRGETLDALQYLTSLNINKGREDYIRITLDSEGYRKKREEALVRLANRMANRARKTGRRVNMEPMNPYERRIFHSALQSSPGISTHSEGEEPNRHIVITPVKNDKQDEMERD